jgi:hypothetical protein
MEAWPRSETGAAYMPAPGFSSNVGEVPTLDGVLPRDLEGGAEAIRDTTAAWAQRRGLDLTQELAAIPDAALQKLSRRPEFHAVPGARAQFDGTMITLDPDPTTWNGSSAAKLHELGHFVAQDIGLAGKWIPETAPNFASAIATDSATIGTKLETIFGTDWQARLANAGKDSELRADLITDLKRHLDPEGKIDWAAPANRARLGTYFDTIGAISGGKVGFGHQTYDGKEGASDAAANLFAARSLGWPELADLAPESMKTIVRMAGL